MNTRSHDTFETESSLLNGLLGQIQPGRKVAIVAGHFMLMYDDVKSQLVPMIWQDTDNEKVASFSQKMAGDFPVRSFAFGVLLRQKLLQRNSENESRLTLLVNDHIYQTPHWNAFTPTLKPLEHRALRKKFYRQKYPLPPSYREILGLPKSAAQWFVDNSNANRSRNDILPKRTFYFSEQALRNRFDKYTRDYLRLDPAFIEAPSLDRPQRLLFLNPSHQQEQCLTEDGSCGCSGEVIEFLMALIRKGYETVIFIVPDECRLPAMAGIEAAVYHQAGPRRLPLETFALFGFGGLGSNHPKCTPTYILEHVRNLDA